MELKWAIGDILLIAECMSEEELKEQLVIFLPFRGYARQVPLGGQRRETASGEPGAWERRGTPSLSPGHPAMGWSLPRRDQGQERTTTPKGCARPVSP